MSPRGCGRACGSLTWPNSDALVRSDQLPDLLGITDPAARFAFDALVDLLADHRVFDGLAVALARRVAYVVAHAAILDNPTRPPVDAARIVAREAERTLARRGGADSRPVGLALTRAVVALLG
ncbi:hypothetical protein [Mycobacteroides salmoniphilum]|uniref:Uncharacterized protein n=1 Tax=Mycobacteroides salmoniphilum TaxID=404941 RepID=A0A4R8SHM0_9MYCO|nr:hypothetical protein [Mycobacteroides salmoniphilum]TDZ96342.1 hypothetical protein CCUG60885_02486 [Mycobacteroides salmoniphilum]TEA05437.1 hypothetical protein CCUG60883_02743 [Mycobacteroides salmoniphilum]